MNEGQLFSWANFQRAAESFLADTLALAEKARVPLLPMCCDHLCYRVTSASDYEKGKRFLHDHGRLLVEAPINGRPISTYFLPEPFRFEGITVELLELPAPKPGSPYAEGFEHSEWVFPGPLSELLKNLPHVAWDRSNESNPRNPDLSLRLAERRTVKFHPTSLLQVIQEERLEDCLKIDWSRGSSAFQFSPGRDALLADIEAAQLNERLASFPLREWAFAGTFPLRLDVRESDIDVLVSCDRQLPSEDAIVALFADLPHFSSVSKIIRGKESLVVRFQGKHFPFEIFFQALPLNEQFGYQHLIAEAKLLALAGEWSLGELQKLRATGLKTEPAFSAFFQPCSPLPNVSDPYEWLFQLGKLGEPELRKTAERRLRQA